MEMSAGRREVQADAGRTAPTETLSRPTRMTKQCTFAFTQIDREMREATNDDELASCELETRDSSSGRADRPGRAGK